MVTRFHLGETIATIIGILFMCLAATLFIYRSEHRTYIDHVSWRYEIIIEEYTTVVEESRHLPSNARELDRWSETERYVCGTDSDGDTKYCRRSYTMYRYEIDKWVYSYTKVTQANDKSPYWADVEDLKWPDGDIPRLGNQRATAYRELYYLHFDDTHYSLARAEWETYDIEHPIVYYKNGYGFIVEVRKGN